MKIRLGCILSFILTVQVAHTFECYNKIDQSSKSMFSDSITFFRFDDRVWRKSYFYVNKVGYHKVYDSIIARKPNFDSRFDKVDCRYYTEALNNAFWYGQFKRDSIKISRLKSRTMIWNQYINSAYKTFYYHIFDSETDFKNRVNTSRRLVFNRFRLPLN